MPKSKHTRKGVVRKHVKRPLCKIGTVRHPQKSFTIKGGEQ